MSGQLVGQRKKRRKMQESRRREERQRKQYLRTLLRLPMNTGTRVVLSKAVEEIVRLGLML